MTRPTPRDGAANPLVALLILIPIGFTALFQSRSDSQQPTDSVPESVVFYRVEFPEAVDADRLTRRLSAEFPTLDEPQWGAANFCEVRIDHEDPRVAMVGLWMLEGDSPQPFVDRLLSLPQGPKSVVTTL